MNASGPDEDVRPAGRRLSEVLAALANDPARETITFADIRDAMGDRAFGALLFVFAAPVAFPVHVPGVSTVLGAPLLVLALQLVVGLHAPWLPAFLKHRSMRRTAFARAVNVVAPWMRRVERLLRPRLVWLARGPLERLVGLVCFVLALVVVLPIPFGNIPPAMAICILALALLERDGVAMLAGLVVAAVALFIGWGVLVAIFKAVSLFVRHLLGL